MQFCPQPSERALFAQPGGSAPGVATPEVKNAFGADIPLSERDDWEKFLAHRQASHQLMTAEIVTHETRLNAIVYEAFHLTPDDIALIEKATEYPYCEV
jgi:hypothetical protein